MNKIYECFNFFNELDILELRLNILYDVVDYFIIVESNLTHSGNPKPFYFEENKDRFSNFLDKIISYKIYDNPEDFTKLPNTDDKELEKIYSFIKTTTRFNVENQQDYGRDFFQKESVRRALINCDDNDIIIISDADEIPNPYLLTKINKLDLENVIYSLNQPMYYFYLNVLKESEWCGSKMGYYKNMKKYAFNEIRGDSSLSTIILNAGWHFSFMGGEEMVKNKMLSYSARDMVDNNVLSKIKSNMENNIDPYFRCNLSKVEINSSYPEYILNNLEKYKNMIKQ